MEKLTLIYTLDQLRQAAEWLLAQLGERKVIAFYGQVGAGKTTLIKELCNVLGVTDNVTSPTFALINEYHTAAGNKIFHFDFYRIANLAEAYDLGIDEYFESGSLCFVEWPELVEKILLKDSTLRIKIDVFCTKNRVITTF